MRQRDQSRREFLSRILKAGAAGAVATGIAWYFHDRTPTPHEKVRTIPDHRVEGTAGRMAIAGGPSPARNVRAALAAIGGMGAFVRKGEVVLVKPNVGWDRLPEQAADTNPELVREIVRMALEAGAREVIVTDVPCNDPKRSFERSGIEGAAREAGARVLYPPLDYVPVEMGGKVLGRWDVIEPLLRADRVINVPIVKHHGLARGTLGMKNWYGILGKRRFLLHQRMDEGVVELEEAVRPTLTVIDATRVLMRNGPQGGSLADVKTANVLAAGTDPVALDSWGAEQLGLRGEELGSVVLGEARGLGTSRWKSLGPREVTVG